MLSMNAGAGLRAGLPENQKKLPNEHKMYQMIIKHPKYP
jgi:hypothetical protein